MSPRSTAHRAASPRPGASASARRRPPPVRLVRRAHGRCVYTRHLRARPPHGRRRTASGGDVLDLTRELGVDASSATRAATSSPATAGRTASARRGAPARLDLAWRALEPNAVRRSTSSWRGRARRRRADDGGQPRHPRRAGGRRPARVLQPPRRHLPVRPAPLARREGAARHPPLVPGQRAGRAVADRAQDGATSTAGSPRRRPRRCAWSTRAIELVAVRQLQQRDADLRRVGGRGPRAHLRARRLHLAARPTTSSTTATSPASSPRRWTWTPSSTAVVATADHVGARAAAAQELKLSFDEWNVWYQQRFVGQPQPRLGRRPALIEDDVHRRRRGRGRQPPDHAAPPRRPGRGRLPGPAGQRHRADPDRARRAGLAADDLPPVRPDRPARARPGAARRAALTPGTTPHGSAGAGAGRHGDLRRARPATLAVFAVNRSTDEPLPSRSTCAPWSRCTGPTPSPSTTSSRTTTSRPRTPRRSRTGWCRGRGPTPASRPPRRGCSCPRCRGVPSGSARPPVSRTAPDDAQGPPAAGGHAGHGGRRHAGSGAARPAAVPRRRRPQPRRTATRCRRASPTPSPTRP